MPKVTPNRPREEVLRAFKELFLSSKLQKQKFWRHRVNSPYEDPEDAWRLSGEFSAITGIAFEQQLEKLYRANG